MTSDSWQGLLVATGLLSLAALAGATVMAMWGLLAPSLAMDVGLAAAAVGLGAGLTVRGRGWTSVLVVPTLAYLFLILTG